MEFRLLGAFEVSDKGQPVGITGSKQRALLALLVLRANEVVRSELLVDELWGDRPPRNATSALHTHVSRLRKTLGADTIARREWGYVLRAAPADIDLRRFEGLLAEAEQLAAKERARKLAEALALWRGPPLADLVNEPALERDIAHLEELRLSTLERRIDADLEAGQTGNLVGELEGLIAEHPLREHLRWLLILSLYRAGRQAEALEVYRETRRVLTDELGLEPSPALKELEQAILRQDPSLDANAAPTHAEPVRAEPEPKRRRVPPVAILALLALGLAGTATAIALLRPERGTSSAAATQAIFETLTTLANPTTDANTRPAADGQRTIPATTANTHTAKTHTTTAATTNTNHVSTSPPTTTVAHKVKDNKGASQSKPVTITDDFGDPTLNPLTWSSGNSGPGASFMLANGQLVFSIAGDATLDPRYHYAGSGITTKCELRGNFDARIHFKLLQWPPANGATISLTAQEGTTGVELVQRVTTAWGDGYNGWPNGRYVSFPVQSGSLRLTRSKGVVQGLYRNGNAWVDIPAGAVAFRGSLQIGVGMDVNQADWQHQDVSAAVDNFKLTAQNADCPQNP